MLGTVAPPVTGLQFVQGDEFKVGHPAPEGKKIVQVVEFWATYSDKDVYFVGVTDEKDVAKISAFVKGMGSKMSYPVAIDSELSAKRLLFQPSGARGIPHVLLIGVEGKVVWMGHPMDPQFEQELDRQASKSTPRGKSEVLVPLPLITETYEELMQKPVSHLKGILTERKIDFKDCFEKGDLAKRVVDKASNVTYYQTKVE
ncbi:hypothetical protein HDU97_000695 [Phlyctochytrium planicorne]|nr:hypothetical protein HDU97_000695 [Phlyctochytrium planicorne]